MDKFIVAFLFVVVIGGGFVAAAPDNGGCVDVEDIGCAY